MTRLPRRQEVGSGVVLIAVLTLLYQTANGRYESIETVASAREALTPTLVDGPGLQPSSAYGILEERPLLSPTRRPRPLQIQPDPTIVAPQPPPASGVPTLLGTIIGPERRTAFVRANDGPTVTVAEGSAVAGWTLDQVRPGEVVFRMGAKIVPVKLAWSTARQNTAAASLVADTSTMPMRGRGGWLEKP